MAKNGNQMQQIGAYAFIGGIALSLALGVFVAPAAWMVALLAVLGLLVALLNITDKEVTGYLIANIAVIVGANGFNAMIDSIAGTAGLSGIGATIQTITSNLVFFVAPGAVLIALREIYSLASSQ